MFLKRRSSNDLKYWIAGLSITMGASLGAGIMYFLDPNCGDARRRKVSGRAARLISQGERLFGHKSKHILERAEGLFGQVWRQLHRKEDVSDELVLESVRSRLGRVLEHPQSISTQVEKGIVTLRGTIDRKEKKHLLKEIREVPGVSQVEDFLVRENRHNGRSVPKLLGGLAGAAALLVMAVGRSHSASRRAA